MAELDSQKRAASAVGLLLFLLLMLFLRMTAIASQQRSHRTVTIILFALLTLALLVALDLDRPWNGAIMVFQQPMLSNARRAPLSDHCQAVRTRLKRRQ